MLTSIDRYIVKRFFVNLLLGVLAWIIIFIVIDLIENISHFLDRNATYTEIFLYYVYYIPYIISLTLPVAMLLSTLFTLSAMAINNEIVALLSSGVSLFRILMPLFVVGLLVSVGAFFFNEVTVPYANQKRYDIKRYQVDKEPRPKFRSRANIYLQVNPNETLSARYFNGVTNQASEVSIKIFSGPVLRQRIDARKMVWQDSVWKLVGVTIRKFAGDKETLSQKPDTLLKDLHILPEDLAIVQKKPEEMSYTELGQFIAELRALGANPRKWIVERYLKISLPFANLIVVLLGAPLASRKRKGGMGLNFGFSLGISFLYFMIIRVGQVLGHQGTLNPLLGAWLGNLVFLTLGIIGLLKVRK